MFTKAIYSPLLSDVKTDSRMLIGNPLVHATNCLQREKVFTLVRVIDDNRTVSQLQQQGLDPRGIVCFPRRR